MNTLRSITAFIAAHKSEILAALAWAASATSALTSHLPPGSAYALSLFAAMCAAVAGSKYPTK